jgi:hypothetical protein
VLCPPSGAPGCHASLQVGVVLQAVLSGSAHGKVHRTLQSRYKDLATRNVYMGVILHPGSVSWLFTLYVTDLTI